MSGLPHKTISNKDRMRLYARSGCNQCSPIGMHEAARRWVKRHFDEEVLEKAHTAAIPDRLIPRMATVDPTVAILKRLLSQGRCTCWG